MEIYFWSPRRVRLIGAVGAEQTLPDVNPVWDILKLGYSHKISKNWNIIFDYIFFIFDYVKKCHFWPIKYRLSQNRLPVSLWKCENQVRDPKLGLETCLVDPFCDFHFWPSIHVRVPTYSWLPNNSWLPAFSAFVSWQSTIVLRNSAN